jgi:IS30 family transposase
MRIGTLCFWEARPLIQINGLRIKGVSSKGPLISNSRRLPMCPPEQISGWLKLEFPTHQDMQISHEAIYRSLFIQTRGVLNRAVPGHWEGDLLTGANIATLVERRTLQTPTVISGWHQFS